MTRAATPTCVAVAKIFKSMQATVWGLVRTLPREKSPHVDRYHTPSQLPELLRGCDYIVNILPSTPDTVGLLNGGMLQNCSGKRTVLINVGRGSIVTEGELVRALEQGWLEAALLDVFEKEPLPQSSPLWGMPQVRITPHIAGITRSGNVAERFKVNFERYMTNKPLLQPIDLDKGY